MVGLAKVLVELWRDRRGITAAELGILAGMIGGGVAMGAGGLGDAIGGAFGDAAGQFDGSGGTGGSGATDGSGTTDGGGAGGTGGTDGTGGIGGSRANSGLDQVRLSAMRNIGDLDRLRDGDGSIFLPESRVIFLGPDSVFADDGITLIE